MVVYIISGLVGITPSSGPTSGLRAGQHSTWQGAFHGEGSPGVSMRGGPGGHGTTPHQCHCPHRSPGRPTNGESNPPEALGCRGAPIPAGALNHIWHQHAQIGPYFGSEPLHLGVFWGSNSKHRLTQLNI